MKNKSFKIVLIAGVWLILVGGMFYGAAYALGERQPEPPEVAAETTKIIPNIKIIQGVGVESEDKQIVNEGEYYE